MTEILSRKEVEARLAWIANNHIIDNFLENQALLTCQRLGGWLGEYDHSCFPDCDVEVSEWLEGAMTDFGKVNYSPDYASSKFPPILETVTHHTCRNQTAEMALQAELTELRAIVRMIVGDPAPRLTPDSKGIVRVYMIHDVWLRARKYVEEHPE